MKIIVSAILAIIITLSIINVAWAEDYRLGSGDVLTISVFDIDELKANELIVRSDGKIAYPIVGEVLVSGLSTGELTKIITAGLSHYVKDPMVTVNVTKFRTTRIYVLGEVARPGMYELEKQHSLLDAIATAGSYTKDALKKKVFIIGKDSRSKPIEVNLLKLLRQGDMTQNYVLNEGDVVYLAPNGRIDLGRDVLPYISLVYQIKEIKDDD